MTFRDIWVNYWSLFWSYFIEFRNVFGVSPLLPGARGGKTEGFKIKGEMSVMTWVDFSLAIKCSKTPKLMTYPQPRCRASTITCRAQCKMKIQGPLFRNQDKNVFFPSAVSQLTCHCGLLLLFCYLMLLSLGHKGVSPVPRSLPCDWVRHKCPKLAFSTPRPPPGMEGNISHWRDRRAGGREPNVGRQGGDRRWDFTWAKAPSPQCTSHHPIRLYL